MKLRWLGSRSEQPPNAVDLHLRWLNLLFLVSLVVFSVAGPVTPAVQSDAQRLACEVIQNEVRAEVKNHSLWGYRELKKKDGNELLLEYCETKNGTIYRLLAIDGRPLNSRQQRAEDLRIQKLIRSPGAVRAAQKKEDADATQERRLFKLFPDVFIFHEVSRESNFITMEFSPNPKFHPSGSLGHVLQCLQGTMVVDAKQKRLVSIDGRLTSEVKFWGGLAGHLDAGGTFSVSMQNVAPGDWELKSLDVEMHGKALLFKSINVQQHDSYSNYTPVPPDTTLAQVARRFQNESRSCPAGHIE